MDENEIERRRNSAAKHFYTRKFVSELATEFEIGEEKIEILRDCLCYAAAIYQIQKNTEKSQLKVRDVKGELTKIEKFANAMMKSLNTISGPTRDLYWAPLRYKPIEYYLSTEPLSVLGFPVVRYPQDAGKTSIDFPSEHKVKKTIMLAANLARDALDRVQSNKGGRPSSRALWMWVANMYHLWETHLNQQFTYLKHQGTPVSQAFQFCCRVFEPLDPSISKSLLGTTMRSVIRDKGVWRSSRKKQKGALKKRYVSARNRKAH